MGYTDASMWILLGTVVIASVWHPFRADTRSAAASAGLRLGTALALFIGMFFIPGAFDRGVPGGQDTSTCPGFVGKDSDAWWAGVVLVGLVWWFGVGVLKASAVSIHRHERHYVAIVLASGTAVALALVADFVLAFSTVCP